MRGRMNRIARYGHPLGALTEFPKMNYVSSIVNVAIFVLLSTSAYAMAFPSEPTLKVGDTAPMVDPMEWLQGTEVHQYKAGHVYVVEFWATWCPPCIKAIPHLSLLQQTHRAELTIISVNVEGVMGGTATPTTVVYNFMKKHGKEMQYTVAMEDPIKRPMSTQWVSGSGSLGAPTAIIIDRHGKIAWIGYPNVNNGYTFDQALDDTLAGSVDLRRSRALQASTNRDTVKYWNNKSQ